METARFILAVGSLDGSGSLGCTGWDGPEGVLLSKGTPADFAMLEGVEEPVNNFFFSGNDPSSNVA